MAEISKNTKRVERIVVEEEGVYNCEFTAREALVILNACHHWATDGSTKTSAFRDELMEIYYAFKHANKKGD